MRMRSHLTALYSKELFPAPLLAYLQKAVEIKNGDINQLKEGGYQALQSDRNSFCEDVVSDSFNIAFRDEGRIFYRKYDKQIFWDLY